MKKNTKISKMIIAILCVIMLTACGTSSGHTCGVCGKSASHQVGSGWYCNVHYKDAQMLYNKWK
jgi:uncharacterized lipoprotein YehR (DUF1307 family)